MKNTVKILTVLVTLMLLVSCTTVANLGQSVVKTVEEVAEKAVEAVTPAPKATKTMVIVTKPASTLTDAPALNGIATVKQCFNATSYPKAYSLKTIIDEDCWYKVEDDFTCSTGSIGDIYLDSAPYSSSADVCFTNKLVAFMKDVPGSDYDAFVGRGQKSSYECWYKAYVYLGDEAVLFVPGEIELATILLDGLNLNEDFQFVNAKYFDFTDVNGNVVTLTAEDVADGTITLSDDLAHAILECGDVRMEDLYSITPSGFTKDSTPIKGRINRFVVALSSKSVYGKEAPTVGNVAGTYYDGIPVQDIFAAYNVTPEGKATIKASGDFEEMEDLSERVLIWHKTNLFTVLDEHQIKNKAADQTFQTSGINYDNAAIAFLTEEADLADLLETFGMAGTSFEIVYADGTVETLTADAAAQFVLAADTQVVAVKAYN